jgi:hypothetical protein
VKAACATAVKNSNDFSYIDYKSKDLANYGRSRDYHDEVKGLSEVVASLSQLSFFLASTYLQPFTTTACRAFILLCTSQETNSKEESYLAAGCVQWTI